MQHCTDRCSALMLSLRSKGPRFVGLRKFYCGDFCRSLADSQRSLTEVGQVCNQILNSQEEFSSKQKEILFLHKVVATLGSKKVRVSNGFKGNTR